MNGLSPEILHNVFIQLSLDQRLKYRLVCRHWHTVLYSRSLLYEMILNNQRQFGNFIDMLQRHPSRTNQVGILIVGRRVVGEFDNRKFCNMLPNLRLFKMDEVWRDNPTGKSFELVNPNTKLEVIKEFGDSEFIDLVLRSNTCTRLRELDLTFPVGGGNRRNTKLWGVDFDDARIIYRDDPTCLVIQKMSLNKSLNSNDLCYYFPTLCLSNLLYRLLRHLLKEDESIDLIGETE